MKLTAPQREALEILAGEPEPIEGWKRSNIRKGDPNPRPFRGKAPMSRVNMRAAGKLVRLKLARATLPDAILWSAFTHDEKYEITEDGRALLGEGS